MLKELVEKRLHKGDTAEEIAVFFEEDIELIHELIAEITLGQNNNFYQSTSKEAHISEGPEFSTF